LSTPIFLEDLTDISEKLMLSKNKLEYLKRSLQRMNQNLPAACYMPILKESQRNFMILNIAEQESRMFVTAEHIPYMVCIEVFQP